MCFSCRRRLAGKTPIRRYNPASARTLAVHLASQDNPYQDICPNLRQPKEPPDTFRTLIFSASPRPPSRTIHDRFNWQDPSDRRADKANIETKQSAASDSNKCSDHLPPQSGRSDQEDNLEGRLPEDGRCGSPVTRLHVVERPASKDYRSFAASVFGTAAFKMLEWLTPQSVRAMSATLSALSQPQPAKDSSEVNGTQSLIEIASIDQNLGPPASASTSPSTHTAVQPESASLDQALKSSNPGHPQDILKSRRNSKSAVSHMLKDRNTLDASALPPAPDDLRASSKSPNLIGLPAERKALINKKTGALRSCGVPEIPNKPLFFENVPSPTQQSPATRDLTKSLKLGTSIESRMCIRPNLTQGMMAIGKEQSRQPITDLK